MIEIVDLMIECYEMGTSNKLVNNLQEFTPKDTRVVMIEILNWLKLEHKREIWIKEGKKTNLIFPLMLQRKSE